MTIVIFLHLTLIRNENEKRHKIQHYQYTNKYLAYSLSKYIDHSSFFFLLNTESTMGEEEEEEERREKKGAVSLSVLCI